MFVKRQFSKSTNYLMYAEGTLLIKANAARRKSSFSTELAFGLKTIFEAVARYSGQETSPGPKFGSLGSPSAMKSRDSSERSEEIYLLALKANESHSLIQSRDM